MVDRGGNGRAYQLERWRHRVMVASPPADDLTAVAWADARARFNVPLRYAEQLIDGVAQDLTSRRYATFEELAAYSYGVASTVGLMSMHTMSLS
jgi:phytoene synthase